MNRTFATTVPPAAAVLVACGRDPADQCASAVLRDALARVTDWEQLGDAALRHGMAGLLYRRVTDTCPAAVPAAVLAAWRERTLAVAQRSLRMQRQLLVQLERLAEAGVPALILRTSLPHTISLWLAVSWIAIPSTPWMSPCCRPTSRR